MHKLFSYGYAAGRVEDLQALAAKGVRILDVRFVQASGNPAWRKDRLVSALGDSYEWLAALGNRRYRDGPPVELADPEQGFARLERLLEEGPVCLLCACPSARHCHRTFIARQAAERWPGLEVEHLRPGLAGEEAVGSWK